MRAIIIILVGILLAPAIAKAEIEKFFRVCEKEICFYWWPKLGNAEGWHQDQKSSVYYEANTLAPNGFTFANAETVIYAKAIYKPHKPELKSIEMLIEDDKEAFLSDFPGILIEEVSPLFTADKKRLISFTFFPTIKGSWERVSYGEEDDFYIIFTLSSRSLSGYNEAMAVYEKLIADYKEKP